jgi:acetyl esterase/lipase
MNGRTPLRARTLSAAAAILAALTIAAGWAMATPARWDGLGKLGVGALSFPLHLLAGTLLAVILAWLAARAGARLAVWISALVAVATMIMALVPTVALWRKARELNAPISLGSYIVNGAHMNLGEPQRERSVVYARAADGTKLELDVWSTGKAKSGPLRPAVVLVHGGAWSQGTRSMLPDWNRWLNSLDYEVFDVEYRLPPPVRWLDEVGDVKSAVAWVAAQAANYHVDRARISIMGGSAGANLSMLAAYSMGDPRLPPSTDVLAVAIRSVINIYGPTDMALGYRVTGSPGYVRPLMDGYIGGSPDAFPDRYRLLSPLTYITPLVPSTPPTLTLLGTSDRLVSVDHAQLLDEALTRARVPHETYLLPATDHGFDVNWGGFATQIARAKIRAFLEKHVGW